MQMLLGIPTPFPTVGKGALAIIVWISNGFVAVWSFVATPDFCQFPLTRLTVSTVAFTRSTASTNWQVVHRPLACPVGQL